MKNRLIKLFLIIFFLLIFLFLLSSPNHKNSDFHLAYPFSKNDYLSPNTKIDKKTPAKAIIIPHHLLAKDLINQTFSQIQTNPSTIVLLGPNHENKGSFNIQTTDYDWLTDFGKINASEKIIQKLINKKIAFLGNDFFHTEHSITGLVSFLKIYFPQSQIVPIILKYNTTNQQAEKLAEFLADYCNDCLIIGSVDFTHQGNLDTVKLNDQKSVEILASMNRQNTEKIICDSPQTLKVILSFLQKRQGKGVNKITQDNSFSISGKNPEDITSYIAVIFE